jgi:cytoskeleton protein RodZ
LKDKTKSEGSDFFIGARLAARRQKAGIALEKAAKDTRIPVARLQAIEGDDFSSFAHPTYARMFLTDYANYLGVPLEEIREYLPGGKNLGTADNNYLDVLLATPGFLQGDQFKSIRRLLLATGILIGIIVLVFAGIYAWRTWKKFERVKPTKAPALLAPAAASTSSSTPAAPVAPLKTESLILMPASSPTPIPESSPDASPAPTATPLKSLPPFEPAPRPKRPQ